MSERKHVVARRVAVALAALLAVAVVAMVWYVNDYYRADEVALAAAADANGDADGVSERDIEGGNHAYFGNYGEQAGDGQATISRDDQQEQTAEAIASMLAAA